MATKDGTYSTASDREADQARSREDWSKLHVMVLRHKCNSYGLDVTGLKKVIRERLFLHFNPQEAETTETHEASSSGFESTPPPEDSPEMRTPRDEDPLNLDAILDYNFSDDNGALSDGSDGRRAWRGDQTPTQDENILDAANVTTYDKGRGQRTNNGAHSTRRRGTSQRRRSQRHPPTPPNENDGDGIPCQGSRRQAADTGSLHAETNSWIGGSRPTTTATGR